MKQNRQEAVKKPKALKRLSWGIDRAMMGFVLLFLAAFIWLNQEMISWKMNAHMTEEYSRTLVFSVWSILLVLGLVVVGSAALNAFMHEEPTDTPTKECKNSLEEYKEGNKLAQEYFKGSWVASSIFFPICFGLIGVSFTKHTLPLEWFELLPLAGASLCLFIFCWGYTNRYAQYSRSIWKRLWEIEAKEDLYMGLHHQIKKDDDLRPIHWRIRHLNWAIFGVLVFLWFLRIWFSTL